MNRISNSEAYNTANEKVQKCLNETRPSAQDFFADDTPETLYLYDVATGGPTKFFIIFVAVALIVLVAVQFVK